MLDLFAQRGCAAWLQLVNFAQAATGRAQPVVPLVQSAANAYVSEAVNTRWHASAMTAVPFTRLHQIAGR